MDYIRRKLHFKATNCANPQYVKSNQNSHHKQNIPSHYRTQTTSKEYQTIIFTSENSPVSVNFQELTLHDKSDISNAITR